MSVTKLGAVFTVVEPITIDGEPMKPGHYIIYNETVFLPNRTVVWELPPIENAEDAPDCNMIYGFSFGGISHEELLEWIWEINGEPHSPRPTYPAVIEGGGRHDIAISVAFSEEVESGREFNLTATIGRK